VGEALGCADGDAVGLADPDGVALGEVEALDEGEALPDGAGDWVGPRATGRGAPGRAAKKRGGRLNVGTSSQNGACGSSAKYRLACGSAALPLVSIRNGPISQSAGMARTRKKIASNPAKNSQ